MLTINQNSERISFLVLSSRMSTKKFLYVCEDQIPPALKCKLCHQPFNDPVIAPDENRYCHSCIVQHYQSTNSTTNLISKLVPVRDEIVYEMLGLLLVQCTECKQDDIKRAEIDQHHEKFCPKRIVACSAADLKCPWRGSAETLPNHRSQCPYEPLRSALEIALNYSNEVATMKIQLDQSEEKRIKMEKMLMASIEVSKRQVLKIDDLQKRMDEQLKVQVESEEKLNAIVHEQQLMNQARQEERETIHELEKQLYEQKENQMRFQREWQEKLKTIPNEQQSGGQIKPEDRRMSLEDRLLFLKKQCDKHDFQISLISKKKTFPPGKKKISGIVFF